MTLRHEMMGIYTVWLREFKRFYRDKASLTSSIVRPLMWLLIMGFGIGGTMRFSGADTAYLPFLTPGIVGMSILFTSLFSGISVIWDREFGFLKEMLVAPISRVSIVIGKALGGATSSLIQSMIIILVASALGVSVTPLIVLKVMVATVVISIGFVSLGVAIASWMDTMEGFNVIMNFIVMPMFMLSGALFPISNLPGNISWILYANPMSYCVEVLRYIMTGAASMNTALSMGVVLAFAASTSMLATYMFGRRK